MRQQFADLPLWEFSTIEVERSTYKVVATRVGGFRGETMGGDPDAAVAELGNWATKVESDLITQGRVAGVKCPVCDAAELTAPPYEHWPPPKGSKLKPPYGSLLGTPSYEVCPNCGFEFGFDDEPGTAIGVSFAQHRQEWIAQGSQRFDKG